MPIQQITLAEHGLLSRCSRLAWWVSLRNSARIRGRVGLGFLAERVFAEELQIGIFSSGCNEYVYRFPGDRFR